MKKKALLFAVLVVVVTVLSSCSTKKCPAYSQVNNAQLEKVA